MSKFQLITRFTTNSSFCDSRLCRFYRASNRRWSSFQTNTQHGIGLQLWVTADQR